MAGKDNGKKTVEVRVVKLGRAGGNKPRQLPQGSTVADALKLAGHDPKGFDVRVNNKKADLGAALKNGQILTLTPVQIVNGRS